jgi:predicted house-cleaning noncanonical NTP pyrophosphatase (MazG superfamily)/N-acetylglutamate synthase-like GNAT family acetyltransferase
MEKDLLPSKSFFLYNKGKGENDMRMIPYNKLIRDRIPEIIRASGNVSKIKVIKGAAYREALEAKLLEEFKEWQDSYEAEELADLFEVVRAMAEESGHSIEEIQHLAEEKRKKRGGFTEGIWLESVEESSDIEMDKKIIISGLRAYNRSKIGEKSFPSLLIEIQDDNLKRMGAIAGKISWDYFEIIGFYVEPEYRRVGIGKTLINAAAYEARERFGAPKMEFVTSFPELQTYLSHTGWAKQGQLAEMPKGFCNAFFYRGTDAALPTLERVSIQESLEGETGDWLQKKNEEICKQHGIDRAREEKTVLMMDANQEVLGGVYGYIERDWLYVSLLWVDDSARGLGVGTQVMDRLERWAEEKGIRNFYVGTAEFQARPFYEKRGYRVITTCVDQPKGYECYTLIKEK